MIEKAPRHRGLLNQIAIMFQLTKEEAAALRSQNTISSSKHGGRRYAPYVFTEKESHARLSEIFEVLRELMAPTPRRKQPVGFRPPEEKSG
jgi:ORF6N domain